MAVCPSNTNSLIMTTLKYLKQNTKKKKQLNSV